MPGAVAALTGAQLRAHRILNTGLARSAAEPDDLPLWDLGIQDRDGSSRLAIATRLVDRAAIGSVDEPGGTGGPVLLWSLRGAPHLHRRADAARFAAALWPADDADAAARLSGDAGRLHSNGADPLEAYRVVSDAMRQVITDATVKGAASAAVTAAIPAEYAGFCRACGSVHVREMLFRVAALPAAVGLVADTKPVVLEPLSHPYPKPSAAQSGPRGLDELVKAYYRLYGTGTAAEVATHLGTSAGSIRGSLPADLVTVTVDGARTKAPAAMVDQLVGADVEAAADLVRLLPAADPLLQPRDRSVLAPDRAAQKALWPILGSPGAVLTRGGLAGFWRTRSSGRTLTVTVTLWRKLAKDERTTLQSEAELVGTIRGAARTQLVVTD